MSQAEAQQANLVGAVLAGKYELQTLLGEGAMGAVYKATTPDGRLVAVKTLLAAAREQLGPEALTRFVREAQVSSSVKNPHVVEVLDAGHDEQVDVAFMVMELLNGEDLDQLLVRTGALSPEVAVRIALQAARGLGAAHKQGIVHRDVKPSNIYLHHEGDRVVVKVCDFGIAKEQKTEQGLTQTGSVLGSPLYMSPEQLLNAKKADHRADIWGLAMSTFDALAGEPALKAINNLTALVMALARQDVRTLSEAAPWCDPKLSSALEGALRRDPSKRYETMDTFIEALVPYSGGSEELRLDQLVSIDPEIKAQATPQGPRDLQASNPALARTQAAGATTGPSPDRYVGQTLARRYVLQRLLRQGADGWIFEARTANSGRPCHVRLIPKPIVNSSRDADALVERALQARDLRHPNLVRVLDAGIDPISTMPYVVFEPCEGRSLAQLFEARGKLDRATSAGLVLHAARGLAALHSSGRHHGGVRASSIHVIERESPDGKLVLVAQLAGHGEAKLSFDPLPSGDSEAVTPQARSMAPEQARESGQEVSIRTDFWGLSLLLYEALAGRHPFGAYRSMGDLILAICVQEIPRLATFAPDADPTLAELISRGLQRNVDKRPAAADEFIKALAPMAGPMATFPSEKDEDDAVEPPPEKAVQKAGVSSGLKIAVAVALLVAVVCAVLLTQMK
jgi:serine/threonine protein kinase